MSNPKAIFYYKHCLMVKSLHRYIYIRCTTESKSAECKSNTTVVYLDKNQRCSGWASSGQGLWPHPSPPYCHIKAISVLKDHIAYWSYVYVCWGEHCTSVCNLGSPLVTSTVLYVKLMYMFMYTMCSDVHLSSGDGLYLVGNLCYSLSIA